MKKIIGTFALFLLLRNLGCSQILTPVHWSFETQKVSDTEFDLVAKAKLDKGWYVYTQNLSSDDGPIPTKFTFKPSPQYQLVGGKPKEVSDHKKEGFDKVFQMNVTKFSESVQFIQRIKLTGASANVTGTVEYGTCDDEKCLPPQEENFSFNVTSGAGTSRGAVTPAPSPAPANTPVATPQYPAQNNVATASKSKIPAVPAPQAVPNVAPIPSKNVQNPYEIPQKPSNSGIQKPVTWTFETKKSGTNELDFIAHATIEKEWHIYSLFQKNEEGPVGTSINFDKNGNAESVEQPTEKSPKKHEYKSPEFNNIKVVDFSESATFTQKIKITDVTKSVSGNVEFMACNNGQCLPPETIAFNINAQTGQVSLANEAALPLPSTSTTLPSTGTFTEPSQLVFDKTFENSTCNTEGAAPEDHSSLWWIFVLGFGGGLLALLTPCVFPMIPLTVSFFTKGSKDRKTGLRNAWLYSLSIIVMYVSMGLLITSIAGSDALNRLSTDPWMNLFFGILFLVFAISFFGYFEITLPSSWTNKADEASNKGGLVGIFFMAFTLALVSFSCTGPIIGTLLVQTATSNTFSAGPVVGMLGFSMALALPFGLFAAFPAWLQSLPKSGSWMDDVKVTLGFIEVALAFKFLSNTDLTKGWKALPYEAFLTIWILCALGLALYHAGILKFKKDAKPKILTKGRGIMVALSLISVAYMGMGFRYSPETETFRTPELLSGVLPQAGYSYIYPQKCPLNLSCFHDLNEGMAFAKKVNKPILLDFTGWNCANCRKMEDNVWTKPEIIDYLKTKYVLVSLYTDDKSELKAPYASYVSKFDGKTKDTEGKMWTDLEATFFNKNSQPYYVLLSPDLKVLNAPVGYTPEIEKYKAFLDCGLERFRK